MSCLISGGIGAAYIKAMPGLRALHEKYKQNLTIIGIAAEHDDDRQVWLNTIQKHQAEWVQV